MSANSRRRGRGLDPDASRPAAASAASTLAAARGWAARRARVYASVWLDVSVCLCFFELGSDGEGKKNPMGRKKKRHHFQISTHRSRRSKAARPRGASTPRRRRSSSGPAPRPPERQPGASRRSSPLRRFRLCLSSSGSLLFPRPQGRRRRRSAPSPSRPRPCGRARCAGRASTRAKARRRIWSFFLL